MRRTAIVVVLLAGLATAAQDATAASWWWSRKYVASLRVTQAATWQTVSARPCEVTGSGSWEFRAAPTRPVPVRVEYFGGGYVTRGEGGYRVTDAGRRRHYALPATGTATADVVQQPSGDPDSGCDAPPDLTRCGTWRFPRPYTGGFLEGRVRVGRLALHIEDIRDPDEQPLPSPEATPCLRIDPRLPGAGSQLDVLGTALPVRSVFRRRTVVFRGERRYRPRRYGVEVGGVGVDAELSVRLSWELRLRAAGRARQQCSYETRRNRCPRL
jgi:hypothetical protein